MSRFASTITAALSGQMRVRRTVRRVEYRCAGLRSRCFILSFLFAFPLLVLYHTGLLFKDGTVADDIIVDQAEPVAARAVGRPAVGQDEDSHDETWFDQFNTNILVYNRKRFHHAPLFIMFREVIDVLH